MQTLTQKTLLSLLKDNPGSYLHLGRIFIDRIVEGYSIRFLVEFEVVLPDGSREFINMVGTFRKLDDEYELKNLSTMCDGGLEYSDVDGEVITTLGIYFDKYDYENAIKDLKLELEGLLNDNILSSYRSLKPDTSGKRLEYWSGRVRVMR